MTRTPDPAVLIHRAYRWGTKSFDGSTPADVDLDPVLTGAAEANRNRFGLLCDRAVEASLHEGLTVDGPAGTIDSDPAPGLIRGAYDWRVERGLTPMVFTIVTPANFAAVGGTNPGEVALSWDTVAAAVDYVPYQDGVALAPVTAPTTTVTVTGLTSAQSYDWQVAARDADGRESAKTAVVTAAAT